jgi:dTDP-4-amino-4,6-dideoxygalactose transaminase
MNIPFVNLKAQYASIQVELDKAIHEIINTTAFIGGKPVSDFETAFAELYGINHCISVANGTDSLYIIMKMLGIGKGDEVITTAHSWISSAETISQTGAKVVFVDSDPEYFTISSELLESKITKRTKAIIPVHLYGQVCDMEKISEIAIKHNLFIIEDCAQSHFSEFKGKLAGTIGIAGSFSFYPGKNLGAYGDAGCIITNDNELATRCRMFARHGALVKHEHLIEGINSRMDGLQAAILGVKLRHILNWTDLRISNAQYYNSVLGEIKNITIPKVLRNTKHTFHLYVIKAERRNELADYLKSKGIETAIHYPRALPNLPAYNYLGHTASDFPNASNLENQILSLPMYPELTRDMMDFIAGRISEFYN